MPTPCGAVRCSPCEIASYLHVPCRDIGVRRGRQSGTYGDRRGKTVPSDSGHSILQDKAAGPGARQEVLQAPGADSEARIGRVDAHQEEGLGKDWENSCHGGGAPAVAVPSSSGEIEADRAAIDVIQAQCDRDGRKRKRDFWRQGVSALGKCSSNGLPDNCVASFLHVFVTCADEKEISCRDIRVLSQDGASRPGCGPQFVRGGACKVGGQGNVRDTHERVRPSPPAERKEGGIEAATCTSSYERGRRDHRRDSGGGGAITPELAPVPGEVARLSSVLGGVASAGPRIGGRSGGKLGTCAQADRHSGIGKVGNKDIDQRSVMLRACYKCGGGVFRLEQQAHAGIACDGASHVGDRSLLGRPYFPCYTCGLDWCEVCASMLQPSVGADVIRIKLQYDKSEAEEPTLKLGWAHAISKRGTVAGSGPRPRRDHGHLVPRAQLHEAVERCQGLEREVTALQAELKLQNDKCLSGLQPTRKRSALGRSLHEQTGRPPFDSPPPLMAPLKDDCKRALHHERRAYQEKYCSTQLLRMKKEVAQAQDEAASARQRAAEITETGQQKEDMLRKRLRCQRTEHLEEVSDLMTSLQSSHAKEMELQELRLQQKHDMEMRSLRQALAEQEVTHAEEIRLLRGEAQALRWLQREQTRQVREEVLSESAAKIEYLRAEWEREREADRRRWETENEAVVAELRTELAIVDRALRSRRAEMRNEQVRFGKTLAKKNAQIARLQKEKSDIDAEVDGISGGGAGRPAPGLRRQLQRVSTQLDSLCEKLQLRSTQLPALLSISETEGCVPVELDRHGNSLFFYNVRFVAAALRDRHPDVIAAALHRNNQIDAILRTRRLQPAVKGEVERCLSVLQRHWSARHSVILMSEVHTSRPEFDALRHLLSFVYHRSKDAYERIPVWTNPTDPADKLFAPTLAARQPREAERALIYGKCNAQSSDDGLFSGVADLQKAVEDYVTHYWSALDPGVQTGHTPLMITLTGDATGGWRGDAVTHGEIGIGSWAAGKAQSKLTLLPIFLMEGDDSAENLRNRMAKVAASYNAMKKKGSLTVTIKDKPICLRTKLLVAADFQFFKAQLNMSKYTSAIWCTCKLDAMYKSPADPVGTWEEVHPYYARAP